MPLINHCNGGGGTPQLCGQVENFKASLGNLSAILSWTAPSPDEDNSFVGARIVRKTGSAPTGINDGTVVYEGTALSYTDTGLTAGTTYYYRAFAYNAKKKYQTEYRVASLTAMALNSNFASNTWEQIIAACQSGSVPDTWVAGDNKTMTIDGADYQIDIIGKSHDTYAAGGTAPLTFQLHDCFSTISDRGELSSVLTKLPESIQSGIKSVSKTINNKSVSLKLFNLTENEVFGAKKYATYAEGTQYAYYAAGNSKIKKVGSNAAKWWLSSLVFQSGNYVQNALIVSMTGASEKVSPTGAAYLAFAFCF